MLGHRCSDDNGVVQAEKQHKEKQKLSGHPCPESCVMSGVAGTMFHQGLWIRLEMETVAK